MSKRREKEKKRMPCGNPLRLASLLMAVLLCLGLAGCAGRSGSSEGENISGRDRGTKEDERLFVATTIFPYYDFVRQIGGDRVRLKLVVPAGMDSHSFEPTPADMITLQNADLLICNGGAMEQWVEKVSDSLDTSHMRRLTMMDYVDVVEEEVVEGMEEEGHDHSHEDHDHAGHDEADHNHKTEQASGAHETEDEAETSGTEGVYEPARFETHDGQELEIEYDEHIWTSPVNAMEIVKIISDTLANMDPANEAYYRDNEAAYLAELSELDSQFRQVVSQGRHRMMVVADKFPLRYFADTYGLSYRAAFSGCSTDTEPSAKTIAYLIDRVRENHLTAVYYLELSSHRTADIISEETGAKPLLFHSCHNVSRREFDEGVTYLQLMRRNVENLRQGLK